MADEPNLDLLMKLANDNLAESRLIRAEQRELRDLVLKTIEYARRVERRIEELRDDLELMIKAELGGRLAHVETRLDEHIDSAVEEAISRHGLTP